MAEVKKASPHTIDRLLDASWASWEELPRVASEIGDWTFDDQISYAAEWPLEEDRLILLEGYKQAALMTDVQLRRYQLLTELVTRNRPIREGILHG